MGSPKRGTLVPVVGKLGRKKGKTKKGGKKKKKSEREMKGIPALARTRTRRRAFGVWNLEIFEPEVLERAVADEPEEIS